MTTASLSSDAHLLNELYPSLIDLALHLRGSHRDVWLALSDGTLLRARMNGHWLSFHAFGDVPIPSIRLQCEGDPSFWRVSLLERALSSPPSFSLDIALREIERALVGSSPAEPPTLRSYAHLWASHWLGVPLTR